MLLILCLPAFFLFSILQMTTAVLGSEDQGHDDHGRSVNLTNPSQALTIIKILFYIIQVMIQTPMIIDGLRRCSNSLGSQGKWKIYNLDISKNVFILERKYGRNTLMFLIVTNLAVYIMETFLLKVNKPLQCSKFPIISFAFALALMLSLFAPSFSLTLFLAFLTLYFDNKYYVEFK